MLSNFFFTGPIQVAANKVIVPMVVNAVLGVKWKNFLLSDAEDRPLSIHPPEKIVEEESKNERAGVETSVVISSEKEAATTTVEFKEEPSVDLVTTDLVATSTTATEVSHDEKKRRRKKRLEEDNVPTMVIEVMVCHRAPTTRSSCLPVHGSLGARGGPDLGVRMRCECSRVTTTPPSRQLQTLSSVVEVGLQSAHPIDRTAALGTVCLQCAL
jgi:hypothetical protein